MEAYLIGHITVKEPVEWEKYVQGVGKSLQPYMAEIIFRGRRAAVLAGEHNHENVVVIRFPDQKTLQAWYHSAEYQALIPIRDRAADVVIASYDI